MAKVLERSLHQTDYYAWTKQQAAELRALAAARVNSTLDLANLAEEVESLGRSDFATVRSQLRRIIEHLLKLEHSPAADPRLGWREPVIEARDVFADVITATLRREVEADLAQTYQQGRRRADAALRKQGEYEVAKALPGNCPYSFDQLVSHDWFPANRHGIIDDFPEDAEPR
jgi:Domain of unknown function DUF29